MLTNQIVIQSYTNKKPKSSWGLESLLDYKENQRVKKYLGSFFLSLAYNLHTAHDLAPKLQVPEALTTSGREL